MEQVRDVDIIFGDAIESVDIARTGRGHVPGWRRRARSIWCRHRRAALQRAQPGASAPRRSTVRDLGMYLCVFSVPNYLRARSGRGAVLRDRPRRRHLGHARRSERQGDFGLPRETRRSIPTRRAQQEQLSGAVRRRRVGGAPAPRADAGADGLVLRHRRPGRAAELVAGRVALIGDAGVLRLADVRAGIEPRHDRRLRPGRRAGERRPATTRWRSRRTTG